MASVRRFQAIPVGQFQWALVILVVALTLLGMAQAFPDDHSSGGGGGGSGGVELGKVKVPHFFFGDLYCKLLCHKTEGAVSDQCTQCMNRKGEDAKRTIRNRRFDDFGFGLDDYLFMRLLGRNLEDRRIKFWTKPP